jgi:LDH2 family malate/lactate/ureidoglycolate dehydrogenase
MERHRDTEQRIDAGELLALVTAVFGRCGMEAADAALLADSLVEADLGGMHSHGVLRVPEYVRSLSRAGVDPRGRPWVARDSGACLVVDGGNSMGQIGVSFAMDRAIERAGTTGIAAAAVRGSNHCGAMGYFAARALPHDMIGMATTNALPTMAPWGGVERLLGINPLAVAIPAGEERPVVYDGAFSASAHGKIRVYQQKELPIPEGWAVDRHGRATTDPAAAIEGLLLPIGGFKGAGLALVMGIFASMLSGASFGTELGNLEAGAKPGQDGQFVLAMKVAAFEEVDRFKSRVDGLIRQIHACPRVPGVERLYAPGEMEALTREAYRREGIPLNAVTLGDMRRTATEVGVEARYLAGVNAALEDRSGE